MAKCKTTSPKHGSTGGSQSTTSIALTDAELAQATDLAEKLAGITKELADLPPPNAVPDKQTAGTSQGLQVINDVLKRFSGGCRYLLSPQRKNIQPRALVELQRILKDDDGMSIFMDGVAVALENVTADLYKQLSLFEDCIALLDKFSRVSNGMAAMVGGDNAFPGPRVIAAIVKIQRALGSKNERQQSLLTNPIYSTCLDSCLLTFRDFLKTLLDKKLPSAVQLFSNHYHLVASLQTSPGTPKLKVSNPCTKKILDTSKECATECLDMLLRNQLLWDGVIKSRGQRAAIYFKGLYTCVQPSCTAINDDNLKCKAALLLAKLGLWVSCTQDKDPSATSSREALRKEFFRDCGICLWQLLASPTPSRPTPRQKEQTRITPINNNHSSAALLALRHLIEAVGAREYIEAVMQNKLLQDILTKNNFDTLEKYIKNGGDAEVTPRLQYSAAWLLDTLICMSMPTKNDIILLNLKKTKVTARFEEVKRRTLDGCITLLQSQSVLCQSLSADLFRRNSRARAGQRGQQKKAIRETIPEEEALSIFQDMLACLKSLCALTCDSLKTGGFTALPPAFLERGICTDSLEDLDTHFLKLLAGSSSPILDKEHLICLCLEGLLAQAWEDVKSFVQRNFSLAATVSDVLIQLCSNMHHPGWERNFGANTVTEFTVSAMLNIWWKIDAGFLARRSDSVLQDKMECMIAHFWKAVSFLLERHDLSPLTLYLIFGSLENSQRVVAFQNLMENAESPLVSPAHDILVKVLSVQPCSIEENSFQGASKNAFQDIQNLHRMKVLKAKLVGKLGLMVKETGHPYTDTIFLNLMSTLESWACNLLCHELWAREFGGNDFWNPVVFDRLADNEEVTVKLRFDSKIDPLQEIGELFELVQSFYRCNCAVACKSKGRDPMRFKTSAAYPTSPAFPAGRTSDADSADSRVILNPSADAYLPSTGTQQLGESPLQAKPTSSFANEDMPPPSLTSPENIHSMNRTVGVDEFKNQQSKASAFKGACEEISLEPPCTDGGATLGQQQSLKESLPPTAIQVKTSLDIASACDIGAKRADERIIETRSASTGPSNAQDSPLILVEQRLSKVIEVAKRGLEVLSSPVLSKIFKKDGLKKQSKFCMKVIQLISVLVNKKDLGTQAYEDALSQCETAKLLDLYHDLMKCMDPERAPAWTTSAQPSPLDDVIKDLEERDRLKASNNAKDIKKLYIKQYSPLE